MSDDYISREWLLNEYDKRHKGPPGGSRKMIEEAPPADVQPVVHGEWLDGRCTKCAWEEPDEEIYYGCESTAPSHKNFCPNCGAKMM